MSIIEQSAKAQPEPERRPDLAALIDLEYHALMEVEGGDEPAHGRSFVRDVIDPASEAARRHRKNLRKAGPAM